MIRTLVLRTAALSASCRRSLRSPMRPARRARLLLASTIFCSLLPAATHADGFTSAHRKEIQEMVAASVRMETGFNTILGDFAKKSRSYPIPHPPAIRDEGRLNRECYNFSHAKFYAKYRALIDNIDTRPFTSIFDIRENKSDTSILRDPRKIAIATKNIISSLEYLKDFHPPLTDYVLQYSARSDLEATCAHYLDAIGMKS